MFAYELQCKKQNSGQLSCGCPFSECCLCLSRYHRSQNTFNNQSGDCSTPHMDFCASLNNISVLYLACDSKALILRDLLQHLLILALFSFCLIDFSFQLQKLQILQTRSLLLSLLIKEHTRILRPFDDEQLWQSTPPHVPGAKKNSSHKKKKKNTHGSFLGPFPMAKIQNPRSEKRRWRWIN